MGGDKYKLHRKTIIPIFAPSSLQSFLPIISKKVDSFLQRFDKQIEPEAIDFCEYATDFALDTILATMLGENDVSESDRRHLISSINRCSPCVKRLNNFQTFFYYRYLDISSEKVFKWWLNIDPIFKLTNLYKEYIGNKNEAFKFLDKISEVIEKDYQQGTRTERKTQVYLDHIYKIRHTMSIEDFREEFATFATAGFDTTGKAIPGALLLLAMNQDAQEKVVAEMSSILSSHNDNVDDECLSKMIYLDLVIKESLRLIPAVLMTARETSEDVELSMT